MRQPLLQVAVAAAHHDHLREPFLELPRHLDLPRHADQRIFRRQVAVGGWKQRRPLNVGGVVGAAGGHVEQEDAQLPQQGDEAQRFAQVIRRRVVAGGAEAVPVAGGNAGRRSYPGVRVRFERYQIERAQAHPEQQLRRPPAQPGDHLAQKAGAVLEAAAVASRAVHGAEKLVPQIAVAVLHVHEREAGLPRQYAGRDEAFDERLHVGVGGGPMPGGEAELAVQQGMAVQGHRLGDLLGVGPAEAPGVGELQPHQQVAAVPEPLLVDRYQLRAQRRQRRRGVLFQPQLVGVGASGVRNRSRLTAPDQLGAAAAEGSPPAPHQVGRGAVRGPVPALHRLDAEAVAEGTSAGQGEGGGKGRQVRALVERHLRRNAEAAQVIAQGGRRLERSYAPEGRRHPATSAPDSRRT